MANNYATVPAIIPGDLAVQVNLTVSGPNFTFGRLQRKFRIQETANGRFYLTVNYDRLGNATDDATCPKVQYGMLADLVEHYFLQQAAGVPQPDVPQFAAIGPSFSVTGNELRLGAATPYVRLYNTPGVAGFWSVNLQTDSTTRDDTTKPGFYQAFNPSQSALTLAVKDVAGNVINADLRRVFWHDTTLHNITGVTGPQTIASKTIYGNELGPFGSILLRATGQASNTTTGTQTLNIVWGGTTINVLSFVANLSLTSWWAEILIPNVNVTNAQRVCVAGGINGGAYCPGVASVAIDTTVNQVLTLQSSPTDVGNVMYVMAIEAAFLSRTGTV